MNLVPATIDTLALDVTTNTPVVVLKPKELDKVLPIWIGHAEAWAIAMELSGVESNRPMTHDLLKRVIDSLGATVTRIDITELREQTFYAVIKLESRSGDAEIDARPSDSLALALKTKAAIFVNEELLNARKEETPGAPDMPTDPESLRERLRKINPEDFGKYSL